MHRLPFLGFHPFFPHMGLIGGASCRIDFFPSRYLFLIFHPPDSLFHAHFTCALTNWWEKWSAFKIRHPSTTPEAATVCRKGISAPLLTVFVATSKQSIFSYKSTEIQETFFTSMWHSQGSGLPKRGEVNLSCLDDGCRLWGLLGHCSTEKEKVLRRTKEGLFTNTHKRTYFL